MNEELQLREQYEDMLSTAARLRPDASISGVIVESDVCTPEWSRADGPDS